MQGGRGDRGYRGYRGYRDSHQERGARYHEGFSELRHRAMLWRLEQPLLERIVGSFFPSREADYLDFACGTGRILEHIAPLVRSTTGVDISASMLEVARARLPGVSLLHGDLTREDLLGDRRFDLITCFRFFPNAEPSLRAEVIAALVRHLEPEGILVFNNHLNASSLLHRASRLLGRPGGSAVPEAELLAAARNGGLAVLDRHHLGVLPLSDRWMPIPMRLAEWLETALSRLPALGPLAQDLVYVCRRAES